MKSVRINIGGQDRPIHFGVNQTILYCETKGITVNEFDDEIRTISVGGGTGREVRLLLWTGLVDGARLEGEEFKADELTVGDWIEQADKEEIQKAMLSFREQMVTSNKKESTGTAKKK